MGEILKSLEDLFYLHAAVVDGRLINTFYTRQCMFFMLSKNGLTHIFKE